jgi:SNF2 family DNA or RNA helicase
MEIKKFQHFVTRNKLDSKPFQTECFKWCIEQEQKAQAEHRPAEHRPAEQHMPAEHMPIKRGGILALEMGLGKTIIMLGLIKCNIKTRTLIVLPRALLEQWNKSIIKFCGCKPLVYHGSRRKNMKMSLLEVKASPIVITTYGQISLSSKVKSGKVRKRSLLHDIQWSRIICDEAHHVSHEKTNEYKGVLALRTELCWLVTGTPIQNDEKELYNLYSLFGLPNKRTYYSGENYEKFAQQFIFYKTKASAGLVLPTLHEHNEVVEWENDSEREFAMHIHSLLEFCQISPKPIATQIQSETENINALRMKYLSRAQQVCAYPPLLQRPMAQFANTLIQLTEPEASVYSEIDMPELYYSQSKVNAVVKTLLARKANGCGKIVFCQFYAEIDAYAACLHLADPTLHIAKFDGRVPGHERDALLQRPVDILVAQIKMCREGLNMQDNYSEVYFPSPHFNPATEQQAIARCWRMGQKKEVHVFRYRGIFPPDPPIADAIEVLISEREESIPSNLAPMGGSGGASPLTLDMYTAQLHIKKDKFVKRMVSGVAPP